MALLEAPAALPASFGGGDILIAGNALLSETGPLGTMADIEEKHVSSSISTYLVKSGDTLSQIAQMFDVSVDTIVWSNDLTRGKSLTPGQTLVILPISGVSHSVGKGDTVASIAKKYSGDVRDIMSYNNLTENATLAVGDVILVPDGEIATPKAAPAKPKTSAGSAIASATGYFTRPLSGGVRTQGIHGYNGVDIAAPVGTPVYASAAGSVIVSRASGWNGGYGSYVVISHANGTQTLYAHLSGTEVGIGAGVAKGQLIGYVGNTGKSTGPHLHFEVRGAKNPF